MASFLDDVGASLSDAGKIVFGAAFKFYKALVKRKTKKRTKPEGPKKVKGKRRRRDNKGRFIARGEASLRRR